MKHLRTSKILIATFPVLLSTCIWINASANSDDTYISNEAVVACEKYGEQYGICPELLMAMVETESGGDPKAVNGSCKGLMQVSEKWHQGRMERLGVTNIYDTAGNILVATDYLYELFEKYGDVGLVLDVYNGNSKAMSNAESGIISEYASKVLTRSEKLERIHGK